MTDTKWIVDRAKSHIRFKVKHLLITNVQGEFVDFQLGFETEGENIRTAEVDLVIDSKSITTNSPKRDKHLKSVDFLDVHNFPTISFKSNFIEPLGKNQFKVAGVLIIKEEMKDYEFNFTFNKSTIDRNGVMKHAYTFETDIKRHEFGVTWNKILADEKWALVGDTVHVSGNIELVRQDSARPHKPPLNPSKRTLTKEKHFVYTSFKDDLDGSFLWHGRTGSMNHWIFGNCTGDTKETHYRAIKVKQHIENVLRQYPDVDSPCQFLRILHDFTEHDSFLAYSYNEHNSFSMDCAYAMIDEEEGSINYASARMHLRLLQPEGGKNLPFTNISLGYPYYNIGKLSDRKIKYTPGDQLVFFNEELVMQHGGPKNKRLGRKGASAIIQDNTNFAWEDRVKHIGQVIDKWRGKNEPEDIALLQIQL